MATPRPTSSTPTVGTSVYTADFYREVQNGVEYAGEVRPQNADVIAERQLAIREGRLKILTRDQQNTQCKCAGCEAYAPQFMYVIEEVAEGGSPSTPTSTGLPLNVDEQGGPVREPWHPVPQAGSGAYSLPMQGGILSTPLSVIAGESITYTGALAIRGVQIVKENGNCEVDGQDDCVQEKGCRYWVNITLRGSFFNEQEGADGGLFPTPPVVTFTDPLAVNPSLVMNPQAITHSYTRLGEENDPNADVISTTTCTYNLRIYYDVNCGVVNDIINLNLPNSDAAGDEYGAPIELTVSAPWSVNAAGDGSQKYLYEHRYLLLTCGPCTGTRTVQPPID